jgi:hypothetical protein
MRFIAVLKVILKRWVQAIEDSQMKRARHIIATRGWIE